MNKFLTEKNFMWLAIAVLMVLQFCPMLGRGKSRPDAMRQRMSQMGPRAGSHGDTGRGAWMSGRKEGEKKEKRKKTKE